MHIYNDNNMQPLVFFFLIKKKTQILAKNYTLHFFFFLSPVSKEDARFVMSINFLICIGIKLANAVVKSIRALRSPGEALHKFVAWEWLVSGC